MENINVSDAILWLTIAFSVLVVALAATGFWGYKFFKKRLAKEKDLSSLLSSLQNGFGTCSQEISSLSETTAFMHSYNQTMGKL
ncbi:MAG: hypothetical protein J6A09_01820, partial [Alphaproteobacteria bacterium]|nr:hypothetical protein [Alphaproteobacteria bacterium]